MPHSLIRSAAYEPDPRHGGWPMSHHVLQFADSWGDELVRLYRRRKPGAFTLPVRGLNELARAIVPGLLGTGRLTGSITGATVPWLYAQDEIPSDVVMALFSAWAWTLAPSDGAEEAVDGLFQALEDEPPQWSSASVDLLESHRSEGGTTVPASLLYTLLPERVATLLASRPYRTDGGELRFRVVSRDQGAELVSWPPRSHTQRGQRFFYSAVITISVQTVPFATAFRVHTSSHLRRWASVPGTRPRPGTGSTVLFDVPVPWVDLETERTRLVPNCLRYDRALRSFSWGVRGPVRLLSELDVTRDYPEPADLLAEPGKFLRGSSGIAAGLVHSNGMGEHAVGPGLMPGERAELDHWVEHGLAPIFRRVPDQRRAFRQSKPRLLPGLSPAEADKDPGSHARKLAERVEARQEAVHAALHGAQLSIEIYWQHEKTRDQLLVDLQTLLGADMLTHVRCEPVSTLADPLVVASAGGRTKAQDEAVRTRMDEVALRLGLQGAGTQDQPPILAFVELGKKELFPSAEADPKHALRLGFAHVGRLSQFIQDADHAEVPLELRSKSACLDGLRQMGADTLPTHRCGPGVPSDLQYVGLWMIRRSSTRAGQRPARRLIAVRVRPGDAELPVQGWDDVRGEWIPYPRMLLNLAQTTETYGESSGEENEEQGSASDRLIRSAQRQIRALINEIRDRPSLLLLNSPNLRKVWPSLTNGQLLKDTLQFGGDPPQRLAAYGADLRVVLVRDRNGREETAQWYALGGGAPGFADGIWASEAAGDDNRVFTSTTDAPPVVRTLRRGLRKLVPSQDWPNAPRKTAWNPQALELTVLGCLSPEALASADRRDAAPDDPVVWAALAHQSRFHDDHQPLSHPLAQHLAALAEEYVLPAPAARRPAD